MRRLPRSLTSLETWGFGLTTHPAWFFTVPLTVVALGSGTIALMLPAIVVAMMINLQLRRLGNRWHNVAGGTPNYTTRLLSQYPLLGRLCALGCWVSWVGAAPINAIILTDLIKENLTPAGIPCPETLLKLGFTILPYILALNGSRALAIFHLFFIIPAVFFSLAFSIQGIHWLAFAADSPGLFPKNWMQLLVPASSFVEWCQWFFMAIWMTTACDTVASFVADSRRPKSTLAFLPIAAGLIPPIFLGTSWVLMRLATGATETDTIFQIVMLAAQKFWGANASVGVTMMLTSACLLFNATIAANAPRMLYQLALDGQVAPVFAVVSRRGVLTPSLIAGLTVAMGCLIWGDVAQVVVVTGVGWLLSTFGFCLGLWLCRKHPEVKGGVFWLLFCVVDLVVMLVGGFAWGNYHLLLGLGFPVAILGMNALIQQINFAPFQPNWWIEHDRPTSSAKNITEMQVVVLLLVVTCTATASWFLKASLDGRVGQSNNNLFVILLMSAALLAIAIACWTTLPQLAALEEAREQAETRFITALDTVPDTILVLTVEGVMKQINPSAEALFNLQSGQLLNKPLNYFLPQLQGTPVEWAIHSEHQLMIAPTADQEFPPEYPTYRTVEATISQRSNHTLEDYIVILRDITDRKQAEQTLQLSEATLKQQATQLRETLKDLQATQLQLIQTEKMSGLGQMVAGVAHEINNPVNFIHGNVNHVRGYSQDLLELMQLYRQHYPQPVDAIEQRIEEIDLDFLQTDFPQLLNSMQEGTRRIREIVLSLRNFSRLDESEMKQVDLHEGIDSTLLILQNRLKEKPGHREIQVHKHYGKLPLVECHAGQINQVFMNILANAIDAIEEYRKNQVDQSNFDGGAIAISTQAKDAEWISISITNDGPGIPEAIQMKLFDPFFTTKAVGSGTGLGLSISYQIIVEQHGGKLSCVSKPGEDTTFLVEIPIKSAFCKI